MQTNILNYLFLNYKSGKSWKYFYRHWTETTKDINYEFNINDVITLVIIIPLKAHFSNTLMKSKA